MSSPSCVAYTNMTAGLADSSKLILQILKLTLCLDGFDFAVLKNSDTCRVVTSVFKLSQRTYKHVTAISVTYISNNTTHTFFSLSKDNYPF